MKGLTLYLHSLKIKVCRKACSWKETTQERSARKVNFSIEFTATSCQINCKNILVYIFKKICIFTVDLARYCRKFYVWYFL